MLHRRLERALLTSCLLTVSVSAMLAGPAASAPEISESAKLLASDGLSGDQMGRGVALEGDRAVAGGGSLSPDPFLFPFPPGQAYVFGYDGNAWVEEAELTASDRVSDNLFGWSIALADDTIVVGALGWAVGRGAAYVFRHDGMTWVQEVRLTASDGESPDYFGFPVSLSGDTIAIGAVGDDDKGSDAGAAYVFRYDGMAWVEEAKLTASDGEAGDGFGGAAVSGDTLAVGAFGDDDKGSDAGAVYVFRYDGMAWIEEAKLTASDGEAGDAFTVAGVVGDTLVVGASRDDDMGSDAGAVYVFRYDGMAWVEEAKLLASDGAAGDDFGGSVAVEGDTILVGARLANPNDSGAAYAFRRDGSEWVETAKLQPSDGSSGDGSGAVALSGDRALVGALGDDDNGSSSGSAYIFRVPGFPHLPSIRLDGLVLLVAILLLTGAGHQRHRQRVSESLVRVL